jgi:predicted transcriptional regulator
MLRTGKISEGNRNKFEIIAEILRELHPPKGKTRIMTHCNMSFTQSGQYLDLMMSKSLIRTDTTPGKTTYRVTETGRQFQERYYKMALLLDPASAFSFKPKILR